VIKIEPLDGGVIRITPSNKITDFDFAKIAPQADSLINTDGQVRLLLDASQFHGWENFSAVENHAAFVNNHQQNVDRIALLAGHDWQHWLVGALRVFLHPEVRVYSPAQESEAMTWLRSRS
jgi:hypothetical protein